MTYGGNFYLARMEYEATELRYPILPRFTITTPVGPPELTTHVVLLLSDRDLVLQSMDAAKRRSNEDAALSDGTKIGAQTTSRRTASD